MTVVFEKYNTYINKIKREQQKSLRLPHNINVCV